MSLTPIYLIANVDSHQTISSCPTKENRMVPYNGPAFGHAQLDIDLDQSVHHQLSPKVTLLLTSGNPAKTGDHKHCQIAGQTVLVVKQYLLHPTPPQKTKKQYHPWEKEKKSINNTTQFLWVPAVTFRGKGFHRFGSASIRGVLPNWSTWFRLAPVPRSALSRYVNFMDAWICWVMMVAKSEQMWTTRLMTQMVISNTLER